MPEIEVMQAASTSQYATSHTKEVSWLSWFLAWLGYYD